MALTATAAFVGVGLSGCGSGSKATSSGPPASSTGSTAHAASSTSCGTATKVTYAEPILNLSQAAVIVAQDAGYFKAHCLDVTLVDARGGTNVTAAVISGSAQFGGTDPLVVLTAVQKGAPLEAVGLSSLGIPFTLVLNKSVAQQRHLTLTKSLSSMVDGIKGMTIGNLAPGDTGTLILDGLIKSKGHTPSSWITANSARGVASQLAALQHGELQGTFTDAPTPQEAVNAGYGTIYWNLESIPQFKQIAYGVTVTNPTWANSHPQAVKQWDLALDQANHLISGNPAKAAQLLKSFIPSTPVSLIQQTITLEGYKTSLNTTAAWKLVQTIGNQFNLEPFKITQAMLSKSYTTKFGD